MSQTLDSSIVPQEAREIDRWLREGNPTLGWRGDPQLSLQLGVLLANKFGYDDRAKRVLRKGDVAAIRWEVWRHTEEGKDTRILQRPVTDLVGVIPALIGVDPRTPGHENAFDKLEKEDAQVQKDKSYAIQQAHGEHAEHLWKLVADTENGKTTFRQIGGSDERSDRNLAG